jgi:hypothetical protein
MMNGPARNRLLGIGLMAVAGRDQVPVALKLNPAA